MSTEEFLLRMLPPLLGALLGLGAVWLLGTIRLRRTKRRLAREEAELRKEMESATQLVRSAGKPTAEMESTMLKAMMSGGLGTLFAVLRLVEWDPEDFLEEFLKDRKAALATFEERVDARTEERMVEDLRRELGDLEGGA